MIRVLRLNFASLAVNLTVVDKESYELSVLRCNSGL